MKASELFKKRPEKWGLRGDPYFWNHLEKIFEKYECPVRSEDIEEIIKTEYMAVSGEELTRGSMPFVSEYSSGGMSSGKLCGEFWLDKAIPLIKKRNDDLSAFSRFLRVDHMIARKQDNFTVSHFFSVWINNVIS